VRTYLNLELMQVILYRYRIFSLSTSARYKIFKWRNC